MNIVLRKSAENFPMTTSISKMKTFNKYGLPIISIVIIVYIGYIASILIGNELILPSPTAVFIEFVNLLKSKTFYLEVLMNLWRSFYGFLLSFLLSVVLTVIMGLNEVTERLFKPIVTIMRAIPTIAIILWVLMIFKSDVSPVAISFIVIFPILYSALTTAVGSRDKKLDDVIKVYGIKKSDAIFKIILPDVGERSIPQIASTFAFNVKLIVAGEALSYTKLSLGKEMNIANANFETAKLLALTIAVILLSVILEQALLLIWKLSRRAVYGYTRRKIDESLR